VGSIYHFYNGKIDILKKFGQNLVIDRREELLGLTEEHILNPIETLYHYYMYIAECFENIGVEITKIMRENHDGIWLNVDGTYSESSSTPHILNLIQRSQLEGTFDHSISAMEATTYFHVACEGVLCSWVFSKGKYSLVEAMDKFMPRILQTFKEEKDNE